MAKILFINPVIREEDKPKHIPYGIVLLDANNLDFSNTLGVCYRSSNGESHLTKVRPSIANLDILPYPAWDLLPLEIYFSNSGMLYSEEAYMCKRRIDINGSLGCSLVCKF